MSRSLFPFLVLVSLSIACGCFAATPLDPLLQSFVEKHIAPGVVALVANKDGVLAVEKAS